MSKIKYIKDKRIPSVERENIIYKLWNSGKYKTQKDLAMNLEISERSVSRLLYAKKIREKLDSEIAEYLSTRDIDSTRTLSGIEQIMALKDRARRKREKAQKRIKKAQKKTRKKENCAIVEIQKKTDSQKKIEDKITLFQNITFKVMNRLKFNIIRDVPKWAKDECKSLLLMIIRHCQEVLEELNQIYVLDKRGKIIEIN